MDPSGEDQAWLKVMEVATLNVVPVALKAAIELKVMDILAQHNEHLTPAQIASHFEPPIAPTFDPTSLDRILRVLASHGLLSSSLQIIPVHAQHPIRTYGLNSCSRYLLQPKDHQGSLSPYVLLAQDPIVTQCLYHLNDAVLDGDMPFTKAHGMQFFSYAQTDARFHDVFHRAMDGHSKLFMSSLLETYHGFDDITSLVDVGGGIGACLGMITSRHTHIKGINFDLAHVVASAPEYPGVKHVGGDMFKEVPKADAIFMKWILHNWSDAQGLKLLENCYNALPNKGKVIVVDAILPIPVESDVSVHARYHMDLLMLTCTEGGKERTQRELDDLSKASGFTKLQVICNMHGSSVVEIYKDIV